MARDHAFLSMKRPVRLKNEQAKMHMSHVDVSTFASTCLILTHLRVHLRAHTRIHLRIHMRAAHFLLERYAWRFLEITIYDLLEYDNSYLISKYLSI